MTSQHTASDPFAWPTIRREQRPWTRWWWLGSAVDAPELTRQLTALCQCGFGGVEISPIYGAKGYEDRYLPFLSPQWLEMLAHTRRQAEQLDMGEDMILGSGWPYGGPWVTPENAAAKALFETFAPDAQGRVEMSIASREVPEARLVTLMAFSAAGQVVDLTANVNEQRKLTWTAPPGEWTLEAIFQTGTGQRVKRSAPGGEGLVMDHFSARAVQQHLAQFERAFSSLKSEAKPRALFNDSYEVYKANWSEDLLGAFHRRRGYDLRHHLPALRGQGSEDRIRRVRYDYRRTLAEMLLDNFVQPWTAFAHRHSAMTRNQAHGSPGNLIDLYATADIPETEVFGTVCLTAAGIEPLSAVPPEFNRPGELFACRVASSAAHIAGKPLCSCESFTWLGEHFRVPLEHLRVELDMIFARGINHVLYQGIAYSPADAPWPGWLFYASTNAGSTNPFWRDLPAVNDYIARCQSFLQQGQIDNDVLLYMPIHDLWSSEAGTRDLLHFMSVHYTDDWLEKNMPGLAEWARWLEKRGHGFDCISDKLLDEAVRVEGDRLVARGGSYKVLMVPPCHYLPPATLARMLKLARQGATVIFLTPMAEDVPGLSNLDSERVDLKRLLGGMRESGKGRLLIGDLESTIAQLSIPREVLADHGIEFIRRITDDGWVYFLANWSRQPFEGWVPLAVPARSAILFDPATARRGLGAMRTVNGQSQIYLQLDVGHSLILRAGREPADGAPWPYWKPAGDGQELPGPWHIEFLEGGPTLPAAGTVPSLSSWTTWTDNAEALQAFSGTARYSIRFDRPKGAADAWALDLGQVLHSARVYVNGQELTTLYSRPFRAVLDAPLRDRDNELVIEVTNLMANRIADLERRNIPWRKFFFVNVNYEEGARFDGPPMPSGLLGPVRLIPLKAAEIG